MAMRARIALALNALGDSAVEIAGICDGLTRPGNTRLISAVRGAVLEITGAVTPACSSFDEPDCVAIDYPATRLDELAAALESRGYRSATVGGPSWSEQMQRISDEYDGQYPRGVGSERARERDLMGRVAADLLAAA